MPNYRFLVRDHSEPAGGAQAHAEPQRSWVEARNENDAWGKANVMVERNPSLSVDVFTDDGTPLCTVRGVRAGPAEDEGDSPGSVG